MQRKPPPSHSPPRHTHTTLAQVPVLVTHWTRQTYTFLDDDRVTITRLQAVRKIPAMHALRTCLWSFPQGDFGPHADEVARDMHAMLEMGWARSEAQYASFKRGVWARNAGVVRRILGRV
jgi:hypothetical protein